MWEIELLEAMNAAMRARSAIMEIYGMPFDVEIKDDASPVTLADRQADEIITNYLKSAFPGHAFLTEESRDDKTRLYNDFVWIIDPVDGTKDFIAKNGEFTTNIALSYKHEIVVGVIMLPATNEIYYASKGNGSYRAHDGVVTRIHVNEKLDNLTVLLSRFHVNENEKAMIAKHADKIKNRETFGSCLKACRIASGLAELSYRLSAGTKEWDTAASQLIVVEAGGVYVKPDLTTIKYNRDDVYNREGYVIANRIENVLL